MVVVCSGFTVLDVRHRHTFVRLAAPEQVLRYVARAVELPAEGYDFAAAEHHGKSGHDAVSGGVFGAPRANNRQAGARIQYKHRSGTSS